MDKAPTIEEFMPFIDGALNTIRDRLHVGGIRYGEEVLWNLEELGAVTWCYSKAARILFSWREGSQTREDREDSFMDLAGYSVLEMARHAYMCREKKANEID